MNHLAEAAALIGLQTERQIVMSLHEGEIEKYDVSTHAATIRLLPEGVIIGPVTLHTGWVSTGGAGMQIGWEKGMQVTVLFMDRDRKSMYALPGRFNTVEKPPSEDVQDGEFWLVHSSTGTYVRLVGPNAAQGSTNSLQLGGANAIEAVSPKVALGDLVANLTSNNGAVRQSDLSAVVNYINNTLVPALSAVVGPVPLCPAATASSVVEVK